MKPTQQKTFDKVSFQESVKKHLSATYATTIENADSRAWYLAMGRALAELTTFDLLETENDEKIKNAKSVNYLSLEFLIGCLTHERRPRRVDPTSPSSLFLLAVDVRIPKIRAFVGA